MNIPQTYNLAVRHQQSGKLHEAELLYRQILSQQAEHPDALHMLGLLAYQAGQPATAVELIRRAIAIQPQNADYFCNLGLALAALGQANEAVTAYRRSAMLDPLSHETHYNLANSLRAVGKPEEALAAYQHALSLRPNHLHSLNNLGTTLRSLGRLDESINAYRKAIGIAPDYFEAHNNLGNALKDKGDISGAIESFKQALKLQPKRIQISELLAKTLISIDRRAEAVEVFRQAAAAAPDSAQANNGLGLMLLINEQYDEAIAVFEQAIIMKPDDYAAHNNLAHVLQLEGEVAKAIAHYERALALHPAQNVIASNRLMALHLLPEYDAHALLAEHRKWDERFAQPLKGQIKPHVNDRSPSRKLKVGYVSCDLRDHVAGWNMLNVIENHDRREFEIYCYSSVERNDGVTQRLKAHVDGWRSILNANDEQAAEIIRNDGIDILVDLSLHSAGNRLLVFARKPSPVQVTYLGYAGTTGLEAIGYRLSDPYLDPPDGEVNCYSEKTIRLPDCYWCYQPAGPTPEVSESPAKKNGYVTFGCLSNFAKVSAAAMGLWRQILESVPSSKLLLFMPSKSVGEKLQRRLKQEGFDVDRLEFVERQRFERYMATYHRIDIVLEPFPYGGAITTCDSLWMGAPAVSLCGRTAVGRGGLSVLSNVGLPELVARSPEEYLKIATELANDLPRLMELRSTLRKRMLRSPLCDGKTFTRNLEAAYRQMWEQWCAT
jgi:predicted O-linked N-acetylglucosamine transferase (SPINDLY family)